MTRTSFYWGQKMKAELLKGFFEGRERATLLAERAEKTHSDYKRAASDVLTDDLGSEFVVTKAHLLALCDAVAKGELKAQHLEIIASVLVRSDKFIWDPTSSAGALVSKVIYAWEAPEINYVLTPLTVKKFARLLTTGEDTFDAADWSALPKVRV
jgi:hypothetical protein